MQKKDREILWKNIGQNIRGEHIIFTDETKMINLAPLLNGSIRLSLEN